MTDRTLSGKSAIVTGSTSGIGLGIARALAGAGADLTLNGFGDAAEIERIRAELAAASGARVRYSDADMSKGDEVVEMVRAAEAEFGAVDILVNNAGIQFVAPIEEFPAEKWQAILAINLSSNYYAIHAALPGMRRRNYGRIVNVASAHGLVASPFKAAYVAAKHGVVGLTKVVALETAEDRHHLQRDLPGVRAHAAGRGPDRRAGARARPAPRAGDHRRDPGGAAEQALRRGRGARRARFVPVLGCGALDHRRGAAGRRRLDRAMSSTPPPKRLNLALQGGGAHGAFTWGVLDRLLEDPRIELEGICATSSGAVNAAALAHGITLGGRDEARATLDRFWQTVGCAGRWSPIQRTVLERVLGSWRIDLTPSYVAFDVLTRMFSPYQTTPRNYHPLEQILEQIVDFDVVRRCTAVKLFVCATNVRSGKIRVFETQELGPGPILASTCLPFLFQAVEIDGEHYWDGGYMGNPAIYPLIYRCEAADVVIVQINPLYREAVPTTAREILDRVNEISFNSSLMREMRAIAFVTRLIDDGKLDRDHYKRMKIHAIEADEQLKPLGASSKLNAEGAFLDHLKAIGRAACARWLDRNFDQIGVNSTVDLAETYL